MGACFVTNKSEYLQKEEADHEAIAGSRRKIDAHILIEGYIRQEAAQCFTLWIPSEIKKLCFDYYNIPVCDTWNKKYTNPGLDINNHALKKKPGIFGYFSAFGDKIISSGQIYTWRLLITGEVPWIRVGVIKDDDTVLKENVDECDYDWDDKGCFLKEDGHFFCNFCRYIYSDSIVGDDVVILMLITLDMNQHTINYIINDKDYGIACDELKGDKYRLAVTVDSLFMQVELL